MASLRMVWGMPGSVTETFRMECGGGRKMVTVVVGLLGIFVK